MNAKAFAVIISPLVELYGPPKNWDKKIGIYYDSLSDVPENLLHAAVRHCIRTCEFFPKPVELLSAIKDELMTLRERERWERENARALPAPVYAPPTPEDQAYVASLVKSVTNSVKKRSAIMKRGGEA